MAYRTEQREKLYRLFEENPHESFTARELADRIGDSISLSAVYRNLADLEAAGRVSVSVLPGDITRRYRIAGHGSCSRHLHFSCLKCGSVIHLSESGTKRLGRMLAANGLKLDLAKTVINGLCKTCREGS